ncbi:GNAT family N-acetyltransferase [Kitasatospora sp. MBT66]|uniref:GNAT family N-acetyltransferase n=1 Tax=Kitasatospora sp. MBT66 TaxID=1444769 RepID=UPI00068BE61F|nr:GNAT family N-acetyltransferase [Kitasatospora sp. MBT66]
MTELRELTFADADAVRRIYGPESVRHLGRAAMDSREAVEFVAAAVASAERDPRTLYTLGLAVDGDLVGVVKLHLDRPIAAVSYILRRDSWGQGYATEGVRKTLALGLGHLRLPEIHARHHPDNPASGRVLLKAGFTFTGVRAKFLTYAIRPPLATASATTPVHL